MIQKGGLALHNFIDLPNGLSSLCIPLGLHCQVNKQTEKHNYKIVVSNKSINSNIYNNIVRFVILFVSFILIILSFKNE